MTEEENRKIEFTFSLKETIELLKKLKPHIEDKDNEE